MVKKLQKSTDTVDKKTGAQLSGTVKESAQQIWLAGLGAFAKAQEEGGKVFEALVKEGTSIQRKTQAAAEEKISEATNRMASMATDISSRASGQWDKLENIFEDRVSKALNKLGHVIAAAGMGIPLRPTGAPHPKEFRAYLLWDFGDGPIWTGW